MECRAHARQLIKRGVEIPPKPAACRSWRSPLRVPFQDGLQIAAPSFIARGAEKAPNPCRTTPPVLVTVLAEYPRQTDGIRLPLVKRAQEAFLESGNTVSCSPSPTGGQLVERRIIHVPLRKEPRCNGVTSFVTANGGYFPEAGKIIAHVVP